MDARQARAVRNEALFREVNERIKEIGRSLGVEDEAEFVCECGDDGCTTAIIVRMSEYEDVRSHPARFAVVPGHEQTDVEWVVKKNERFAIVEKYPGPSAQVAAETDPRAE